MLAIILRLQPDILEKEYKDGSKFRVSESFVRRWLHRQMNWSVRKATRAAHKLPVNWEDQCEKSALRKAYSIKEYDIPDRLFINADQTQMIYAPGDKLTWAATGSSQVSVLRAEEKRAFTLMVGVTASGVALPFQAVYSGKSKQSLPSEDSPFYEAACDRNIEFVFSGNTTYWSTHKAMHQYVNDILVPYIEATKRELGLPDNQKTLWSIDVWAVHRSKEFRDWMHNNHPNIILDYVPGGCTGVGQPCDVGIQRPLKLSAKCSYHEDVVVEYSKQLDDGKETLILSDKLGYLRNASVRWLVNAHIAIDDEDLVKKVRFYRH